MGTLERRSDPAAAIHDPTAGGAPGDSGLAAARSEARNLTPAGRQAIRSALSENSVEFVRSARQQGGE